MNAMDKHQLWRMLAVLAFFALWVFACSLLRNFPPIQ